ncbi:LysR family transcriptional regulator [Kibdelosporangium aridum]|uniref:LysR family transcriptional regulator n=1 Tax=Kibdelosporangium aridum TaxID=2030 RepID=UPI0005277179
MRDWSLAGLRVFQEVVSAGSFTAAAEALGVSQPNVSRQVAALEEAAGTTLFTRGARGVVLSPAGEIVARHAADVLTALEAAEHELSGLSDRLAGRLKLGAFPTATSVLVPRTLGLLARRHPGLDVRLHEGATPSLLRQLRSGRIEVAVIGAGAGLPDWDLEDLAGEVVFDGDLCVAVPARHRLAGAGRVDVAALRREPWIVGEQSGTDPQFGAWPTLTGPHIRYAVRGWPARLGLVAAGLGISVIPELAAYSVPPGVVLVRVNDPKWRGRVTMAVTRSTPSANAKAVTKALREAAADLRDRLG